MSQAPTQREKAERFRRLHQGPRCFVIPNPYDAGSARLLQSLGFEGAEGSCIDTQWPLGIR